MKIISANILCIVLIIFYQLFSVFVFGGRVRGGVRGGGGGLLE